MGYFERLWRGLPDSAPEHFELRRAFLISALLVAALSSIEADFSLDRDDYPE